MKKRISSKILFLISCVLLLLTVSIGGTIAYLVARTDELTNDFTPPSFSHELVQNASGSVSTDFAVKNTGDTAMFVRALILVQYVSEAGKVHASAPVLGTDYAMEIGDTDWLLGSDGYYYYTRSVTSSETTAALIKRFEDLGNAPDGFRLELQVLTSAIQATPARAVEESWGVTVTDGMLFPS